MSQATIWHNPRCSKSRQTLALLEKRGTEVIVRKYLEDAPSEAEIRNALTLMGISAADLIRRNEPEFKANNLSITTEDSALIAAMAEFPKLIERPVVFANGKAALGRPPEAVLGLLI